MQYDSFVADSINILDEWNLVFRTNTVQPSVRAVAEFNKEVTEMKRGAPSPTGLKGESTFASVRKAVSPKRDSVIYKVIQPNAMQGYMTLKYKTLKPPKQRYCALVDHRLYFGKSKQDVQQNSKFKGYISLLELRHVEAVVGKKGPGYSLVLLDSSKYRICALTVQTAEEFAQWLQAFTGLCNRSKWETARNSIVNLQKVSGIHLGEEYHQDDSSIQSESPKPAPLEPISNNSFEMKQTNKTPIPPSIPPPSPPT